MRTLAPLLTAFLLTGTAFGQPAGGARIVGTVTHQETGVPVQDAHVFVSGSTAGTVTDSLGRFELRDIPLGASRIVISSVGYLRQGHDVVVRRPIRFEMSFALEPRVLELEEILVTAERDPAWDRHLQSFRRGFLGMTPRAARASILNPEVISFEVHDGRLEARAASPIEIENPDLGYRILYFLRFFEQNGNETRQEGEALFTEMEPRSEAERDGWEHARETAYRGSSQHFFRALFGASTRQAGFYIYAAERPRDPRHAANYQQAQQVVTPAPLFALEPGTLTREGPGPGERYLTFGRFLEVVYTEETEDRTYRAWQGLPEPPRDDYQRSWLSLRQDSVLVDRQGSVLDPYGVVYFGFMAFERLADLVPKDYVPLGGR